MFRLRVGIKSWVLSAHIGFAALWSGTVLSMFLLALRNTHSVSSEAVYTLNSAITLLDDYIVIPSAIGSVVTATLLCWGTSYGFAKFYWVISKWILTIGLVAFGTFWLFPWGNRAEQLSAQQGLLAFQNPIYVLDAKGVLFGTLIQSIVLAIIIGISVLKPWGKRPINKNSLPLT